MDNNSGSEDGSSSPSDTELSGRKLEDFLGGLHSQINPSMQIGETPLEQQVVYKVYFFGDNSHSRLGPQQIRKFETYFQNYASGAKKNNKLRKSLIQAYHQLNQNGQNLDYFTLGHEIRGKNSEKGNIDVVRKIESDKKTAKVQDNMQNEPLIKRGRGRPKKQSSAKIDSRQQISSIKEQQKLQDKSIQFPSINQNLQQENLVQKSNGSAIQQQIQAQQQNPIPIQPINEQIQKIKKLLNRSLYKESFNQLTKLQIDRENVIEILDHQFLKILEKKIEGRQIIKLKRKIQKALIDRYFKKEKMRMANMRLLQYDSVRGRAVRKLNSYLRERKEKNSKSLALEWQSKIRMKHESNRQYAQQMLNLIARSSSKSISSKDLSNFTR